MIKITLSQEKSHDPKKTAWNYKKANWSQYSKKTDERYTKLKTTDTTEKFYHGILAATLNSAKDCIPRGRRHKYKQQWSPDLAEAVSQRRKARATTEAKSSATNKTNFNRLTAKVKYLTKKGKTNAFKEKCSQLDMKKEGHKAWGFLNNLEGSKRKTNPQPLIDERGQTVTGGMKKAKLLNKMFSNITKGYKRKRLDKALLKIMNSKDRSKHEAAFDDAFTQQEMDRAIKKLANRKSPGPDNITNEMIKHLGPKAKTVLLTFINKTWNEGYLPSQWRTATITPILKENHQALQRAIGPFH